MTAAARTEPAWVDSVPMTSRLFHRDAAFLAEAHSMRAVARVKMCRLRF